MKQFELPVSRSDQCRENGEAMIPMEQRVPTDQQLLGSYAASQSEEAFEQIVTRYASFVYSAALRQTENQTVAEEITQAVFVILARKASRLVEDTVLAGWLFRAVRYAALDFRKVEARRIRRERRAALMNSTEAREEPESAWKQMAPFIDEALTSLSAKDRHAVLLRFFENKSFRDIGEQFGGNENSARVRVVRALEKLRAFFQKRGLTISAGLLSGALLIPSSQAAPPALANSVLSMVNSGNCPAKVAVFVRAILLRLWWRRWPMWVGSAVLALLLATVVVGLVREERARTVTQRRAMARATALAIDNAISFGDANAFLSQVHFRNREEEQFKPVLMAFIRAAVGLRKQVRDTFDAQPVRLQIWLWEAGQLLQGQPGRSKDNVAAGRVTDDFFQPYLLVLVKVDGAWKWDMFSSLSPEVTRERMRILREKTALCERVTGMIQEGKVTTADQALALVREQN
jgi:RNA polymerase sigma factor (sigma-70 family)